ncbi:CAP domain-containing protein [Sphaerisporangium dianthi]|uniref:CAP domain-containing protein n=1 Tax=Sphaerisporangium dianthi TaxID=1436120 RepID=A0ABV9C941_9ACTN
MDRHDHRSPGPYDESNSAMPPEYLSSEPASPSGSRRRTLVICAAAAVFAAAVTAGGVITLTGGSDPVSRQSSEQAGAGGVAAAGDGQAATDDSSADDDATSDDGSAGSADIGGGADGSSGAGQSGGEGQSGGGAQSAPNGQEAEPVGQTESTKSKLGTKTGTQAEGQGIPGPDGPAGYVEPNPQLPGRSAGLGDPSSDPAPNTPPSKSPPATPTPKPKPTAKPTAKPSARPTPRPSARPTPKPTKSPAKPAPPPADAPSSVVAAENEVARLTNVARQEEGCGPLRIDEHLRAAARGHSDDMAAKKYFDHTSADGRSPWDRIKAAGYNSSAFAENIARGQATPAEVVQGWLKSPGHRANIMNCKLKAIGVGVHFGSGGPWWTQDFGGT